MYEPRITQLSVRFIRSKYHGHSQRQYSTNIVEMKHVERSIVALTMLTVGERGGRVTRGDKVQSDKH